MTLQPTPDSPLNARNARHLVALREGPRHGAAMLRRPRCGRPAVIDAAPPLRPRFTDWALI